MLRGDGEAEIRKLIRRYVTRDQRYLKLGGLFVGMGERERARFARRLGRAAGRVSGRELGILLDGGWRESRTAAWLIAVAGRSEFRGRLGELLFAGEESQAGDDYCVALASFGTSADAELLAAYLDRYLRRPDLDHDQAAALGALMVLDVRLGAGRADRFLVPDGLWERWVAGQGGAGYGAPDRHREAVGRCCALAEESAGHCTVRKA
ncbi:DUF6000 family protein [Streptomyces sp. NPDC004031]